MDPATLKSEPNAPRKRRFVPKAPPRRVPKPEVKSEVVEDTEADQARDLLQRFNEGLTRAKPKFEKKVAPSQIAFGYGGSSTTINRYGVPKNRNNNNNQDSPSAGIRQEKEYKEPWSYYDYYPTTLPVRRPYAGNPEILDEEEFGEDSESTIYDESLAQSATELGLMEENPDPSMFFFQLPPTLPSIKRLASTDGQEAAESSQAPEVSNAKQKPCALSELPAGFMGKMLVYESGAIKLKIGETLYDVSSGMDCVFSQDVVAINKAEKKCYHVGELTKRAIVTPDVESILDSFSEL